MSEHTTHPAPPSALTSGERQLAQLATYAAAAGASVSVEEIDRALRLANAEGLLRYTLADVADEKARRVALEAQLAAVRGGR